MIERIFHPASHIGKANRAIIESLKLINEGSLLREVSKDDAFRKDIEVVVINYTGNAPTMRVDGFDIWKADIGGVSEQFADICLKECLSNKEAKGYALRTKKQYRIYILKDWKKILEALKNERLDSNA